MKCFKAFFSTGWKTIEKDKNYGEILISYNHETIL